MVQCLWRGPLYHPYHPAVAGTRISGSAQFQLRRTIPGLSPLPRKLVQRFQDGLNGRKRVLRNIMLRVSTHIGPSTNRSGMVPVQSGNPTTAGERKHAEMVAPNFKIQKVMPEKHGSLRFASLVSKYCRFFRRMMSRNTGDVAAVNACCVRNSGPALSPLLQGGGGTRGAEPKAISFWVASFNVRAGLRP